MTITYHEISPGYGNKGINAARELLVNRMRAAAVEAVGHEDKIRVTRDGAFGLPFLVVEFEPQTKLVIRLWQPHAPAWGISPWVFFETNRFGDLFHALAPRPIRWDSEVEMIYAACQKVLATVELIPIP